MSEENKSDSERRAAEARSGISHGQIHAQMEEHAHLHIHEQMDPRDHYMPHEHHHENHAHETGGRVLMTVRGHSGLSGDIFLAGLAVLNMEIIGVNPLSEAGGDWLAQKLAAVMPQLKGAVTLARKEVYGILGWHAKVDLPHEHEHRNLEDIRGIIASSGMSQAAREKALAAFDLLARCEADAHGVAPEAVHFHEVGALDSILDICMDCELFAMLAPRRFVCSPLPIADGSIHCAHGLLPAPAPATLRMLTGVPVRPFAGETTSGELVTPTAIALLHAFGAEFGPWPNFTIDHSAIVYGTKIFPGAPNGAIFAIGS